MIDPVVPPSFDLPSCEVAHYWSPFQLLPIKEQLRESNRRAERSRKATCAARFRRFAWCDDEGRSCFGPVCVDDYDYSLPARIPCCAVDSVEEARVVLAGTVVRVAERHGRVATYQLLSIYTSATVDGRFHEDWHQVRVRGSLLSALPPVGGKVRVEGVLRYDWWESEDGETRTAATIYADSIRKVDVA